MEKRKSGMKRKKLKPRQKTDLNGSKFRVINERLYTTTSDAADKLFKQNPQYFQIMHEGFRSQAATWPIVPVDEVIVWIKENSPDATIADMGCGDAKIAQVLPNTVHSFDFKANNERVTECDMAHTPLKDGEVDLVTFVLSLMGTNLRDFILEAKRILKNPGLLLIVEVTSRIESKNAFKSGIESLGFELIEQKPMTDFFTWFLFRTADTSGTGSGTQLKLKPCLYKRR